MDPLALTSQLNALLQAIHLPFTLQSPAELTPSLLIAILESILNVRIPIAHAKDDEEKDCEGVDGRITPSQNRQLRTIKIFLGVLETDILQMDVGLSKLDPRLLATGSWDEMVYVAEVLCWIGEELGLIEAAPVVDKGKGRATEYSEQSTDSLRPPLVKAPTPSPSSTITFLPPFTEASPPPTPTTTTLLFATDIDDTIQTNFTSPLATSSPLRQLPNPSTGRSPPFHNSSRSTPRPRSAHISPRTSIPTRVHRHTHSSSFSASIRNIPKDDSSFTRQTPPIRRTGYISLVDHEAELSSFFTHSLSLSTSSSSPPPQPPFSQPRTPSKHKSKLKHTSQPSGSSTPNSTSAASPVTPPRQPSTPRRRPETEQDWRKLLSTSPNHDPRRTYELLQQRTELMEKLLRIRMSQ